MYSPRFFELLPPCGRQIVFPAMAKAFAISFLIATALRAANGVTNGYFISFCSVSISSSTASSRPARMSSDTQVCM